MAPRDLTWKGFEDLVYQIQTCNYPGADVAIDAQITDVITGYPRQVDIAISIPKPDCNYLIVVECKHYKTRSITQPNVEQFASFLKSVGAQKGVMVASSGYSEAAGIYARALDISLFTVKEAAGVEWQNYIAAATRPVVKKRLSSADILIVAGQGAVTLGRDILLSKDLDLNLYAKVNNEFIQMDAYRRMHPEADFNFFLNMPLLPDLLFEMVEQQVTTKLAGSKAVEYDRLRNDIRAGTDQDASTSYINHVLYNKGSDIVEDDNSRIGWWAKVIGTMREMQPSQRRYLRLEDGFMPIDAINLTYRAEISLGRYHGPHELSPLDFCSGIAYVDVHAGHPKYHLLSELRSHQPPRANRTKTR